jgi:hypothetical protein
MRGKEKRVVAAMGVLYRRHSRVWGMGHGRRHAMARCGVGGMGPAWQSGVVVLPAAAWLQRTRAACDQH